MMEYKIVVDTREQKPLWKKDVIIKKLDVGDYSIEKHETKLAIERKSLGDLFGTLGKGHKRFRAELDRALTYDYFAIVIEGSYSDCVNKNFPGSFHSKMKGYVITSILFTLHLKYGINFFFAKDRTEAKRIIKEIFNSYIKVYKPL